MLPAAVVAPSPGLRVRPYRCNESLTEGAFTPPPRIPRLRSGQGNADGAVNRGTPAPLPAAVGSGVFLGE